MRVLTPARYVNNLCHVRRGIPTLRTHVTRIRGRSSCSHDIQNHSGAPAFQFPKATAELRHLDTLRVGQHVVLHGYLGPRSDITKALSFCRLSDPALTRSVQLTSKSQDTSSAQHQLFKSLQQHTPVAVTGKVQHKAKPKPKDGQQTKAVPDEVELLVSDIVPLNGFSSDHNLLRDSKIAPEHRHLQMRQSSELRSNLRDRSEVAQYCRNHLADLGFTEVETPLLFKSTPEGAREFLVPTRNAGYAYALPQSPQQYKQILMASGIPRYFQIAKCFRDEDLRADRQPEFTQLDLEMAFATGEDVVDIVEDLVRSLWKRFVDHDFVNSKFPTMSYEEVMSKYGSDKPDTRYGMAISRIGHMLPVDLVSKMTPHLEPIVEVLKLALDDPSETRGFVNRFMDSPVSKPYHENPDGQPGIFVYNSRQPLGGLMAFGFEAAERLEETLQLEEGDLVVLQARKDEPFSGGSTMLGSLRRDLHRAAVADELLDPPSGWNFLWVKDFPLFTETGVNDDPGQGGGAGFASTHHPFTSPATLKDVELLESEPWNAKADHYDLVLNGIEVGGGSRRIHDAEMQEHVLRDILKMPPERLQDFEHLLKVLRAGCPPHAGIALGFDRLVATMLGKESIRDVIAFPKSGSGEDMLVKSPTKITQGQLDTYHLSIKD